ncbi:hypothetical protein D3C87_2122280 [compost metagenome]
MELDEIRSLADRILVIFDGKIVGEADPATADETELGLLMTGSQADEVTTVAPPGALTPKDNSGRETN